MTRQRRDKIAMIRIINVDMLIIRRCQQQFGIRRKCQTSDSAGMFLDGVDSFSIICVEDGDDTIDGSTCDEFAIIAVSDGHGKFSVWF